MTQKTGDCYSISIYKDELTTLAVIEQVITLKKAFPQLPSGFYEVLSDRIKENGFTDKRLRDAINHLIDNFTYPVPTIANIISFDKRIKLLTYLQLVELVNQSGGVVWSNYRPVKKIGKLSLYASIQDVEMYNLEVLK